MNARDRELGMNAAITRRDFLDGAGIAIGAALLPRSAQARDVGAQDLSGYYPPALTGMRGSHPGSFEVAHALRDGASWTGASTGEHFDLVVVGGGISGLAAAYFYREAMGASAKILVLDNHDDFGGHAKRNEFQIDGRLMIGYGGTMLLEAPGGYPPVAKRLISQLGIDPKRFYSAYHHDLYSSFGLSHGTFFDKAAFGADHLAIGSLNDPKVLAGLPLSAAGKADLARLYADERNYLEDMTPQAQIDYLARTDYRTYLKNRVHIGDEALRAIQSLPHGVWNIGIDALPARTAWSSQYPGFGNLDLDIYDDSGWVDEPNIFHFPDGNATVARLLVRAMIPRSAPGDDMEDIVTARFDYGKLDDPASPVRIRLNSTAVRVRHIGDAPANPLEVTYVRGGEGKHRYRRPGGDGLLPRRHSPALPGNAGSAAGAARQFPALTPGLHQRPDPQLAEFRGTWPAPRPVRRQLPVPRRPRLSGESWRLRLPQGSGRTHIGAYDPCTPAAGPRRPRTIPRRQAGTAGHALRDIRTQHARSAQPVAWQRRLRCGAGHCGAHRQPLAARVRLRIRSGNGPCRVRAESVAGREAPLEARQPAIRKHLDRRHRRRLQCHDRSRDRRGLSGRIRIVAEHPVTPPQGPCMGDRHVRTSSLSGSATTNGTIADASQYLTADQSGPFRDPHVRLEARGLGR